MQLYLWYMLIAQLPKIQIMFVFSMVNNPFKINDYLRICLFLGMIMVSYGQTAQYGTSASQSWLVTIILSFFSSSCLKNNI